MPPPGRHPDAPPRQWPEDATPAEGFAELDTDYPAEEFDDGFVEDGFEGGYDEAYDDQVYADDGYLDDGYADEAYPDEAYEEGFDYGDEAPDGFYADEYDDAEYDDAEYDPAYDDPAYADPEAQRAHEEAARAAEEADAPGWGAVAAQLALGVVGGAGVWLLFNWLWNSMPAVALGAALVVTAGLVWIVRKIRKAEDTQSTVLAVLVGLVVTVSPAMLLLLSR